MDRDRFSASVRRVAEGFNEPITASALADALLHLHPDDYGAHLLTERLDEPGVERTADDWLARCEQIIAPEAFREVIDGPFVLLALARLDERVGVAFRRSGVEQHLHPAGVLAPWARRTLVRGYRSRKRIDGAQVAGFTDDALIVGAGSIERRDLDGEPRESLATPRGVVLDCAVSAEGMIVALLETGDVVEIPGGRVIDRHEGAVTMTFGGNHLATIDRDGATHIDRAGETRIPGGLGAAVSPDGRELAFPTPAFTVARRRLDGTFTEQSDPGGVPTACTYCPDGLRLAVVLADKRVAVRDLRGETWELFPGPADACAFTTDGTLLVTTGRDGVQAIDVVAGVLRGEPTGGDGSTTKVVTGPDGLVATSDRRGTTLWEPITSASMLAKVSSDTADGIDRLNVTADANALADVIAARSTEPPLSIGLFADWGSGKSFLIRMVQQRVRALSAAETSTHCKHVRNVEFNAWHFADANLWASLASHIMESLARAESGEPDKTAAAQLARLEEQLAAESVTAKQLERAHEQAVAADARRKLAFWAYGLATGADATKTVATLKDAVARIKLAAGALIVAAAILAVLVAIFSIDTLLASLPAAAGGIAAFLGATKRISSLLDRAGPATPLDEVASGKAKVEADAAKARVAELRREYEDLAHGRALARYVGERDASGDYRAQLGLISRIHDDFERMSKLLLAQGDAAAQDEAGLPNIDRIVLYIDDLDRCSPPRVVEVLEAVHLILALELFVVVIAVDPRWLLQSLRLHYADLLTEQDEPEWASTPLNYLEKIIQIPFTLRPMGADGTASLVSSLLPIYETVPGDDPLPAPAARKTASAAAVAGTTIAPALSAPAAAPTPAATRLEHNPQALILTEGERDFAAFVACELQTPRAVKKLTNVYRLVRARVDEHSDDFYTFLEGTGDDIPDYKAVLILLTVVIAHPDQAADLLIALSGPRVAWSSRAIDGPLGAFLNRATAEADPEAKTSTEPFRRHARELARYSFEAGQEVFARR